MLQYLYTVGFGGLEVACWPLVPKLAGSDPAEAVGKNPQHLVDLRHVKRSINLRGSMNLGKNYYRTSFSPTVPPFAARISRVAADADARGGESGNV